MLKKFAQSKKTVILTLVAGGLAIVLTGCPQSCGPDYDWSDTLEKCVPRPGARAGVKG